MPIVGITHEPNGGGVRLRRSVTYKVAIGAPPEPGKPYPKKLDHFIFQRKGEGVEGGKKVVAWNTDEAMMKHYGKGCKSIGIVLLDDDADVAFRTELALWTKTHCACRGDGERAVRKTDDAPKGKPWTPCMNHGCPEFEEGLCKPSGDLYFLLEDFPSLGTVCKLHTTSYQSIREIRSALEDLRTVTGGRLMGVRANLTVRLEKNTYHDANKGLVSTTKNILGLELSGASLRALTDGMTDAAMMFDEVKKRLGARSVIVVEDDDEAVAPTLAAEFYPQGGAPAERFQATDDDLPESLQEQPDMTPISADECRMFNELRKKGPRTVEQAREYLKFMYGIERLSELPKCRLAAALRWANGEDEPAKAAPALENAKPEVAAALALLAPGARAAAQEDERLPENMEPDEKHAREGFAILGLSLPARNALIERFRGNWQAIKDEVDYLIDSGDGGE